MKALPDDVLRAIELGAGKRSIGFVVIHTRGTPRTDRDGSAADIRRFHMMAKACYDEQGNLVPGTGGNGWSDIGYNFVVRKTGLVELGRPLARIPAGAKGFNKQSVHVCCTGNGDIADFSLSQYDGLFELCWELRKRFAVPWRHFIGHREVALFGAPDPRKTCPGTKVDMGRFRLMLVEPR